MIRVKNITQGPVIITPNLGAPANPVLLAPGESQEIDPNFYSFHLPLLLSLQYIIIEGNQNINLPPPSASIYLYYPGTGGTVNGQVLRTGIAFAYQIAQARGIILMLNGLTFPAEHASSSSQPYYFGVFAQNGIFSVAYPQEIAPRVTDRIIVIWYL